MPKRRKDLTGKRFGRLTVIEFYDHNKYGQPRWMCECDCGNTTIAASCSLTSGITSSCGCLQRERAIETKKTHGMSYSKVYSEFNGMKNRCYNEKMSNYNRYGGRGIKICDRWLDDVREFHKDVSILPHFGEDGYSIDRIDNNGDYEPNNVRWATHKEQSNNRGNNIRYEYDGKTYTLKEISDITGISYKTLYKRIKILGWSPEKAFNT